MCDVCLAVSAAVDSSAIYRHQHRGAWSEIERNIVVDYTPWWSSDKFRSPPPLRSLVCDVLMIDLFLLKQAIRVQHFGFDNALQIRDRGNVKYA